MFLTFFKHSYEQMKQLYIVYHGTTFQEVSGLILSGIQSDVQRHRLIFRDRQQHTHNHTATKSVASLPRGGSVGISHIELYNFFLFVMAAIKDTELHRVNVVYLFDFLIGCSGVGAYG